MIRFSYPVFLSLASKSKHFITALCDKERLQLLTKFIPNLKNPNMPEGMRGGRVSKRKITPPARYTPEGPRH